MLRANSLFSKSKKLYLAAFFTPVILITVILICSGVFPTGDNCILKTDMYHQYAPFFSEFREKLQNGGSFKFTWDLGLGVNFAAIMAYYLSSPFNLFLAFVGENYTLEFMTVLIVLKAGLSAVAMAVYLRAHAPKEYFGAYIFSLFYALSGYYCAYYWNIMWLDSIAVFPLIILGAEWIMEGKSGVLYAASLGYAILTNYYISIMICIFLVLYFVVYSLLKGYEGPAAFIKAGIRFAFWSLIAGVISAVMLLPEIYALGATASGKTTFPTSITEYFPIIDMLARHMACVQTEQWLDHFPNIYCGTAAYLLFCLYVTSRSISLKEKIIYISAALFMLTGFSINIFNFVWHGLRFPNSLPARQSFIYCFLIIYMCFRVYENRRSITAKETGTALAVSIGFILIAQKLIDNDEFHFAVFYVAILLTALYAGVIHLYRKQIFSDSTVGALLLILVAAELSANTAATSFTITSRSAYMKNNSEIRQLLDGIKEEDKDFYRVERISRKTKDDGAWLNFPSVSIFSSMANAGCTDFFKKLGCEASTNAYSITGSTPLVNMLLGVKYAVYESDPEDAEGISIVSSEGDVSLYENDYSLPLGYALPSRVNSEWMLELDDPVLVQNTLCDELSTGQILVPVLTGSEKSGKYTVTLSEDGEYYAYAPKAKDSVTVTWPDKKKTFDHLDRKYLIELGNCSKGDLIKISSDDDTAMDVRLYRFDYGVLGDIYDKMSECTLNVTDFGDDHISGTVKLNAADLGYSSDKALFMISTPYDEGWKVTVDGEPVKIYKGLDTFTAFYLTSGEHKIEMRYEPQGLKTGCMLSAAGLIILFGAAVFGVILKRRKAAEDKSSASADDPGSGDGGPEEETEQEAKESCEETEGGAADISTANHVDLNTINNEETES